MRMEREQLAECPSGKLRRAVGRALSDEDAGRLERIASRDEWMARAGLVNLKSGDRSWYKHIDDLVPGDRRARARPRATTAWLRGRIAAERVVAAWRENGRERPESHGGDWQPPSVRPLRASSAAPSTARSSASTDMSRVSETAPSAITRAFMESE